MARPKKDSRYINCYMNSNVLDKLEKYCEDTGLTKTVAMERILDKFLTEREK